MTLADTSVWIDYFNGLRSWQSDRLDVLLQTEPVGIGDLILAETLQGFKNDGDYLRAKSMLSRLPFFLLGGYEIAIEAADNYRLLRKRGATIRKTIDIFIATACI